MTSSFNDSIYGQRLLSLCSRGQIERIVRKSNLEEIQKGLATGDFVVVQESAGIMINVSESADFPEDTLGYVLVRSSDLPRILKEVRRFEWFHASNGKVYLEGKWETKDEESRIWYRQRGRENPMYRHPERYEGLEIIHLRNEAGKIVFSYADRRNSLQKAVKKFWYYWDRTCREVDSLRFVNEEIAGLDFGYSGRLSFKFENCRIKEVSFSRISDLSISLVNCQLGSGVSIIECGQAYLYLTDTHWYRGYIRKCDRLEIHGKGVVFENHYIEEVNLRLFDVRDTHFKSCSFSRCGLEGFSSWLSKLEVDFKLSDCSFSYCSFDRVSYENLLRAGNTMEGRNFPKPDLSLYPFGNGDEKYLLRIGIDDRDREWEMQVDLLERTVYHDELKCPVDEFEEVIGKFYPSEEYFNYDPSLEDFILNIMPIIQAWHDKQKGYRE